MTIATTSQQTVARGLLTAELVADGTLADSAAARQVLDKLGQRLALLITPMGSAALLRRAIHLSRAEFSFLDAVEAAPNTHSQIEMLCETASAVEPSQAHEGLVAVIGTMVALLELFIGERLTFRLLSELWPELAIPEPVQSIHKNGTGKLEANR
jgi:hypothetical protein